MNEKKLYDHLVSNSDGEGKAPSHIENIFKLFISDLVNQHFTNSAKNRSPAIFSFIRPLFIALSASFK